MDSNVLITSVELSRVDCIKCRLIMSLEGINDEDYVLIMIMIITSLLIAIANNRI